MNEDRAKRFVWEAGDVELLTNDNMECAGCKFVIENDAIECIIYEVKPAFVMENRKHCPQLQKKE